MILFEVCLQVRLGCVNRAKNWRTVSLDDSATFFWSWGLRRNSNWIDDDDDDGDDDGDDDVDDDDDDDVDNYDDTSQYFWLSSNFFLFKAALVSAEVVTKFLYVI